MKCARTACNNNAKCRHRDTRDLYCVRCARKINEHANQELIEFPESFERGKWIDFANGRVCWVCGGGMGIFQENCPWCAATARREAETAKHDQDVDDILKDVMDG